MPDLSPQFLMTAFLWYVAFLFSTTCHEASHALAAKIGGDQTASLGGQVTLNPLPHIRPELAAAAPAPRGMDGPGGPRRQLHAHDHLRYQPTIGAAIPLVRPRARLFRRPSAD